MMLLGVVTLLAALRVASAASSVAAIPDTPYLELVPLRAAWAGAWTPETLPSPWIALPAGCSAPVAGAPPALFLGADVSPGGHALALLACADGGLVDAASNARISLLDIPGGAASPAFIAAGAADGAPLAAGTLSAVVADGTALFGLACSLAAARCTATVLVAAHDLGAPLSALLVASEAAGAGSALIVGSGPLGTAAWSLSSDGTATRVWSDVTASYSALAYSAARRELALGNASKLVLLDASAGAAPLHLPPRAATRWSVPVAARAEVLPLRRWLWVTNTSAAWGGEVDDAISALVYDDAALPAGGQGSGNGTLWIGTATGLNALHTNGTITRWGGPQGLPVANVTALAIGPGVSGAAPSRHVWIGTALGIVLFDPFAASDVAGSPFTPHVTAASVVGGGGADGGDMGASAARWRYFAGPRHVPIRPADAPSARAAASAVTRSGLVLLPSAAAAASGLHVRVGAGGARGSAAYGTPAPGAGVAFAAMLGGLGGLQPQMWTLADKALAWERYVSPHIFDGQANDCSYPSFGRSEECVWSPGANDGLWSAALLAGEAWRWAVTRTPSALTTTLELFTGLQALNDATGVRGLIARAAVSPAFKPTPNGGDWHASTARPGWMWLGDASSDEVVGHVLAYPIIASTATAAGNTSVAAAAATVLINLARYICDNNFTLIDITGRPTQWGRWDPAAIGTPFFPGDQTRSDNRGENSLEVLALLTSALRAAEPASADAALFRDAISFLGYDQEYVANLANLRITAPDDINYSDDELELFSFLSLCTATEPGHDDALLAPIRAAALDALRRTWYVAVGATRQAIYGAILLACTGAAAPGGAPPPAPDPAAAAAVAADVVWNLRGWALEAADWPMDNSARIDIVADAAANRFGASDTIAVLPMRERQHQRWNADPFGLGGGGGGGEADPGAFLMAYWAARHWGLIAAA